MSTASADDISYLKLDKATPLQSLRPDEQFVSTRTSNGPGGWGYTSLFGVLILADELGGNLSELGRSNIVTHFADSAEASTKSTLLWAICGPDVKALDLKKVEAELNATKYSASSKSAALEEITDALEEAKKIGAVVEAAAKDDPGVAQVLKLAEDARAEWQKFSGANKAAFDRYLALKDAVRSGKSNHKNFAGCWEATQPAFAKLVKATKFPWEVSGDYLPAYVLELLTSTENYITAASFAACSYSVHESGEALAAATLTQDKGGTIRVGWRTLAVAKALDPSFKPKFAERGLDWGQYGMPRKFREDRFMMAGINDILKMKTATEGVVGKMKADGETTKLSFKGNKVDACLKWKQTRKVVSVAAGGDPIYERVCMKRGMIDNEVGEEVIATKFAGGIKPGTSAWIVSGFPVSAYSAGKFTAVLGVPCACGVKK